MSELRVQPAPDTPDYETAVTRWLQEPDLEQARTLYRELVFPLSCQRIPRQSPCDLLFVPVGTQPYAPALAVQAHPAACVALLESPESHTYGLQVARAFPTLTFLHVRIDATDVEDIVTQMRAVFEARGLPERVVADVTGGRKTMTAAVAGAASLLGWKAFYLEGVQVRERDGLTHHERLVELPDLLDLLGTRQRERALALLEAGAAWAAERATRALIASSAASARDRELLALTRAAAAWRCADLPRLRQLLRPALRALQQPPRLVHLLDHPEASQALAVLAWRLRKAQGEREGPPEAASRAALRRLAPLDRLLGRGLPDVLARWR